MELTTLKSRSSVYNYFRDDCNIETDHGIYLDVKLNDIDFDKLKIAVKNYIFKTLELFYSDKNFVDSDNFLVEYEDDILSLPNRTPNGAFYPKKDNINEYNIVQKEVNNILMNERIGKNLKAAANVTVRVMDGKLNRFKGRMYATTKLHSDAWVGHEGDAVFTIGVLGDEKTTLEFNKPTGKIAKKFFEPVDNFDDGIRLFESMEFIGNLKFGYATIFDHGCLHRTVKLGDGIRVSVEFGIIVKDSDGIRNNYGKNIVNSKGKSLPYENIDDILKIGKNRFVGATETLQECYERFKNHSYDEKPTSHISDNLGG